MSSSSSSIKAKLKESRDAIQKKDWARAQESAEGILEIDQDNYNATVFLALALLNLDQPTEAETAYLRAAELQPDQVLAFQGLEKLYTQRKEWSKLVQVLEKQADIHLRGEDATKCGECLQKIIQIQKDEGARSERADALSLVLPGSRFYDLLRTLPEPEPTAPSSSTTFEIQMALYFESLAVLKQVIELLEYLEKDAVDKEVEKRRMHIGGAGKSREVLRNEVGVKIWSQSLLPTRYEEVLSNSNATDQERRDAESKLLRYRHRLLLALPATATENDSRTTKEAAGQSKDDDTGSPTLEKSRYRDDVLELCQGMVIIGVPDELAWSIHLEWRDTANLETLPLHLLRQFIFLFPRSGRSQAFTALLLTLRDEQFLQDLEEARKQSDVDHQRSEDEPLKQASSAYEACPESILVGRIAARLHLLDHDFVSAADIASSALTRLRNLQLDSGLALPRVETELKSLRGVALSHSHVQQDRSASMRLLDLVLERQQDVEAKIARGALEASAGRWKIAKQFFDSVEEINVDPQEGKMQISHNLLALYRDPITHAKAESAWCDVQLNLFNMADTELERIVDRMDEDPAQAFSDEDRARAWYRWGECSLRNPEANSEHITTAFNRFITSLKRCHSFAPTFTALGVYYERFQSPPDLVRSHKCYQKAFELDTTEFHAAFKLAEHYAAEREWELVYLVAKRVVEGEGGGAALGGKTSAAQKHKTTNIWAWKAIGSVRLQNGQAEEAITPLQIALRSSPEDAVLWQRLGEAYSLTGRYDAALKSLHRARSLDCTIWQTLYSIAEVKRELGEFDEALESLSHLIKDGSGGFAVRVAKAEVLLLQGKQEAEEGYVFRALGSMESALAECLVVLKEEPHLRSPWKVVADLLHHLSRLGCLTKAEQRITTDLIRPLLSIAAEQKVDDGVPSVTTVTYAVVTEVFNPLEADSLSLPLALASTYINKLRVILSASDVQQIGPAWADLATTLSRIATVQKDESYSKEAISCIKEALNHEPGNPAFWMALGNLTFTNSVKVSQHAYIRAIENSVHDAAPWTALGLLYLRHGDVTLAEKCFVQSQTLDPDYAPSYVGQAIECSDSLRATRLFSHAVELSEGSLTEATYGLASQVFRGKQDDDLHEACFALSSHLSRHPQDATVLHLSGLLAERLGQDSLASLRMQETTKLLEARFEHTEAPEDAIKFAIAQSNLGRVRLESGDEAGAREACEIALGLLEVEEYEDGQDVVSEEEIQRTISNARMVISTCG